MPGKRTPVDGVLIGNAVYTRSAMMQAIGLGRISMHTVHEAGVEPVEVGGRYLYFGDEIIAYLKRLRDEQVASEREQFKSVG